VKTNQVEFFCNRIDDIAPVSGGQHGRQLVVGVAMDADQIRRTVVQLLGTIPENEAFGLLFSEFPEWFTEAA
jgi:hypothetical protein